MIDINWQLFKAKFNGREQAMFEKLSNMLFCYEQGSKFGIFRFKNQVGIETEPVTVNGIVTGFQAKYYDTKLSSNKADIIDSIKKAKQKNISLQTIIIYTNGEFSESTKKTVKKPAYLEEIENETSALGLALEWRQPSQIEKQLSVPENQYLTEYFFGSNKNIVDFIDSVKDHAAHILHGIQTDARYLNQSIKIDRSDFITALQKNGTQIIILSGEGGSGKTAIIKELNAIENTLVYVFKAQEFHKNSIGAIFSDFGAYSFSDFLDAHQEETKKTVVIDSAEKLADITNQEPFIEFLSAILKNGWKVIFTTRNSYLDDLRFQMIEVYRLPFELMQLDILTINELQALAEKHKFPLPNEARLLNLIRNPFYLNEYLQYHGEINNETKIARFRELLWNKKIQRSAIKSNNIHLVRERIFLLLAKKRCETGSFFINGDGLDDTGLAQLVADEVIGYETAHAGYFITHDIYEEWALGKIIETQFIQSSGQPVFFSDIGNALPMRRAFRAWLSEKLADTDKSIIKFVNDTFASDTVEPLWKDELLVSVLLSDHSDSFFEMFDKELLANNKFCLHKIIFLLRTACKEVDSFVQKILELKRDKDIGPALIFTRPKGHGWVSAIKYLLAKIEQINEEDLKVIVPLLSEWVNKNNQGDTTRAAGLFALHFYKLSETTNAGYDSSVEDSLLKIVLNAAKELKTELMAITDDLLQRDFNRQEAYDNFRDKILTENNDAAQYILTLPEYVIRLADQAWFQPQESRHPFDFGGAGLEGNYSIRSTWHHEYFPASALQTPVYYLLHVSTQATIDFILDFTNRTVEAYFKSGYDESVKSIEVSIGDQSYSQYISEGIWSMYRGNGSPVTPYLLQSIHMALEKYFLEMVKVTKPETIINWLTYLLRNTRSASITAVVTSVVLSAYEQLFDVAILLFLTPDFMRFDNSRLLQEAHVRSLYSIGASLNAKNNEYNKERIATCDDPHRKSCLEHLALQYQYFKKEEISDEEADRRVSLIQKTIDTLYASIPEGKESTEENKILRLLLTRIDRRKMNPKVTEVEKGLQIEFNPSIDEDLKKMTQESQHDINDKFKYTRLKLWAINKFDSNKAQDDYKEYDESPALALKELNELVEAFNSPVSDLFRMLNSEIPGFVCAALIKQFGGQLNTEELALCAQVVLDYASAPLQDGYRYQIADGTEAAISAIPYLYSYYPDEHENYNILLLFILFDEYPIGEYKRACDYSVEALRNSLYSFSPENANKVLWAYLRLKPRFDQHVAKYGPRYETKKSVILEAFATEQKATIQEDELWQPITDIGTANIGLSAADTAFHIIPEDTQEKTYLEFIRQVLDKWTASVFKDSNYSNRGEEDDYRLKLRFCRRYARFLLKRDPDTVSEWITPAVKSFTITQQTAHFISDLVSEEDELNTYDTFWSIWHSFYPVIKAVVLKSKHYKLDEIIWNYLLAWPYWKSTAKSWRSLSPKEAQFFKTVCEELGEHPTVLYSIAKFLNEIGNSFADEGISWIASMVAKQPNLSNKDLSRNTIYYMEVLTRKFVYLNRTQIRTNKALKDKLIVILNFLVSHASVNGYLLREEIM